MNSPIGKELVNALEQAVRTGSCRRTDITGVPLDRACKLMLAYHQSGFFERHGEKGNYTYTVTKRGLQMLRDVKAGRRKVRGDVAKVVVVPAFDSKPLRACMRDLLPTVQLERPVSYLELCR